MLSIPVCKGNNMVTSPLWFSFPTAIPGKKAPAAPPALPLFQRMSATGLRSSGGSLSTSLKAGLFEGPTTAEPLAVKGGLCKGEIVNTGFTLC